ncbi:hypothetical protein HK104_004310 [Borealophlyctis nickersoniae]|nr:hypothetical protein HK104_004310 [Borealophlyctis nickersoniae]
MPSKQVTHTPIIRPPVFPKVPENYPLHNLDASQKEKFATFRAQVPSLLTSDDLRSLEEKWCDDGCLLRYLRATKWNVEQSVERLKATLEWRREFRPDLIKPEEVEPECTSGKILFNGFDKEGRPILYLAPGKENTKTYDRQIRFVVFNLEKCIQLMPPGVESINLVVDYEGVSMFNSTPVNVSIKVLNILSGHYPERLGMGMMVNPSWYMSIFFKILGPFMDPITRSKIHFVNLKKQAEFNSKPDDTPAGAEGMGGWTNIRNYIAPDQLCASFGGEFQYEFKHDEYWKVINGPDVGKW